MKKRIFAGLTALFMLAGAARAAEPVRISAWAQEEVAAARACGVLTADFTDYTAPITRAEFARLAVDCVAAAKQTTVYALAEQYALLPPTDPAQESAPIDPATEPAPIDPAPTALTDIVTTPTAPPNPAPTAAPSGAAAPANPPAADAASTAPNPTNPPATDGATPPPPTNLPPTGAATPLTAAPSGAAAPANPPSTDAASTAPNPTNPPATDGVTPPPPTNLPPTGAATPLTAPPSGAAAPSTDAASTAPNPTNPPATDGVTPPPPTNLPPTGAATTPTAAPTGAAAPDPPTAPLPMHAARTPFTDTDDLYVVLAAALGVVQGEADGRFRPQDGIARCEAAAMLTRCMAALGAPDANAAPAVFSDAWDMPRWAVPSIKFVSGRATAEGRALMGGAGGAFAPQGAYTTEEAVASVLRGYLSLGVGDAQPDWRAAPGYDTVQLAFTAGGDCTFGRGADFAYRGSFDEMYDQKSAAYFFENVRDFRDDDLTMVNFEGTLTTATRAARKQFVFRGRQEYAKILPAGSIDVVTIANNHSRDYLQQGYEDTVRSLSPYVAVSGYDRLPIVTVKGVRVGFASNVGWAFDSAQKAFIQNAVQTLRDAGAELVIFNFHWGTERQYRSNATQRAIAHYAVDCGADLVIGHHPHVVQEVETYKGRQIAYSLGNLCFGGNQNPSDKNCMLFRQNFTVNLDTRAATSAAYRAIPYKVSSVPGRNDYRPTPA